MWGSIKRFRGCNAEYAIKARCGHSVFYIITPCGRETKSKVPLLGCVTYLFKDIWRYRYLSVALFACLILSAGQYEFYPFRVLKLISLMHEKSFSLFPFDHYAFCLLTKLILPQIMPVTISSKIRISYEKRTFLSTKRPITRSAKDF